MKNKEEINLLKIQLYLEYYKDTINERYIKFIDNIVLDNSIVGSKDKLYITTFNNYNNLKQKVNKTIDELEEWLEDLKRKHLYVHNINPSRKSITVDRVLNKIKELKGDINDEL